MKRLCLHSSILFALAGAAYALSACSGDVSQTDPSPKGSDSAADNDRCCPVAAEPVGSPLDLGGAKPQNGQCVATYDFFCSTNWRLENDQAGCPIWRYDTRKPEPGENSTCMKTPKGTAKITLKNSSSKPVFAPTTPWGPAWLKITDLHLYAFGKSCDGTHNDPSVAVTEVAPGAEISFEWDGGVFADGGPDCFKKSSAPAGKYSARVCVWREAPSNPTIAFMSDSGIECASETSIELPAQGTSNAVVEL